ncbi:MAG: VOC family protein [Dehalococcoidales bacterium]|nr:VOC family protein [Dehalococcoidales bacterium]
MTVYICLIIPLNKNRESWKTSTKYSWGENKMFKLHHIGLVAPSIPEATEIFNSLGLTEATIPGTDPIQKVKASFVTTGEGQDVYVELLEPAGEDSPIFKFLNNKGGGLHHLCFEVDDIDKLTAEFLKKGFKMVCAPVECAGYDETYKTGANNATRVAFFILPNKLLIELIQIGN